MRRADRLFRIVQLLRSGRFATGAQLAAKLEISVRTLYRDIADLQASGVLIEGEPGLGYTLRREMDLPPMQFTAEETTALVLGTRMVAAWGGASMASVARDALLKIEAVMPERFRVEMDAVQMYAPDQVLPSQVRNDIDALHTACIKQCVTTFLYHRLDGAIAPRRVRPLALAFWGGVWTLAAWDEHRQDFRNFRLDRMQYLQVTEDIFHPKRGQRLKDYLRQVVPAKELRKLGLASSEKIKKT
ncbi:MAG: YafY family transcriptional regulator [Acidobacteria bacterium]|nr:YafY family transcriptional regulator [Acidobacteriota bacterium]